ncbi:MAG TPA: N-formylglutamate amidohydrolase [Longimicrobiales bacterium]|nr:N-formylglutamate amidohydrolase [Longimicrobiales bacterium]
MDPGRTPPDAGDLAGAAPAWSIQRAGAGPVVATATHQGHDLRPEVAALMALDAAERLREEDPFTAEWTLVAPTRVIAHRSRFEVDLNRPPEGAVYGAPEDAWGLNLWRAQPPDALVRRSRAIHRAFYRALEAVLREVAERHGNFVVFDIHSYNHRRDGPDAAPAPASENPEVNLGTGTLDRARWGHAADAFLASLRGAAPGLDVRENVRFRGGYLPRWVHERFPSSGCALAIEFKKTFMDEWTGRPDAARIPELRDALAATVEPVSEALAFLPAAR